MKPDEPSRWPRLGRHLAEALTCEPDREGRAARQRQRRFLTMVDGYDGMVALRGLLDAESAAALNAALDPLAAPRPAADGTPDPRTPGHRRADALTDLARIGLASGDLPDGTPLPAGVLRRIACDAGITPAVLGGRSQPLDVGRTRRTIPGPLRTALAIRDRGCSFPGCTRPPNWTDAHHVRHWTPSLGPPP